MCVDLLAWVWKFVSDKVVRDRTSNRANGESMFCDAHTKHPAPHSPSGEMCEDSQLPCATCAWAGGKSTVVTPHCFDNIGNLRSHFALGECVQEKNFQWGQINHLKHPTVQTWVPSGAQDACGYPQLSRAPLCIPSANVGRLGQSDLASQLHCCCRRPCCLVPDEETPCARTFATRQTVLGIKVALCCPFLLPFASL